MSKKYMGDKYIKAYKFYRDSIDDKVSTNTQRIAELERTIERLITRLMEMKE